MAVSLTAVPFQRRLHQLVLAYHPIARVQQVGDHREHAAPAWGSPAPRERSSKQLFVELEVEERVDHPGVSFSSVRVALPVPGAAG